MQNLWNQMPIKCDICGQFVSIQSLIDGEAIRKLITPDTYFTSEEYETVCAKCNKTTNANQL